MDRIECPSWFRLVLGWGCRHIGHRFQRTELIKTIPRSWKKKPCQALGRVCDLFCLYGAWELGTETRTPPTTATNAPLLDFGMLPRVPPPLSQIGCLLSGLAFKPKGGDLGQTETLDPRTNVKPSAPYNCTPTSAPNHFCGKLWSLCGLAFEPTTSVFSNPSRVN